jgi:CRISPR system Cascade subunit CasB
MSEFAERFVGHLRQLAEHDRGGLAVLRRSLTFAPGASPAAYPYIERFVPDGHDQHAVRQALYLAAGLYASHPAHQAGTALARSFGLLMLERQSPSIEKRFIAVLSSDEQGLPELLRQVVSLLSADGRSLDYVALLDDLSIWLKPWASDARDCLRQRWARDFYRSAPDPALNDSPAAGDSAAAA